MSIRAQLQERFHSKMNRFGLVAQPTPEEAQVLLKNYRDALQNCLDTLNPKGLLAILSVRTRIKEMGGSFKSGQMRLGVYPLNINFPTAMYFNTGDCMEVGRSQVSSEDVQDGMFRALTGLIKRDYPSDIDLRLERRLLLSRWNPLMPDRGMEANVYRALEKTYDDHGVFINLFPDAK